MANVYRINKKCFENINNVEGWGIAPYEWLQQENIYFKMVEFERKSEPVNFLFNLYNSEKWQKDVYYAQNMRDVYKEIGIKFRKVNKNNKLRMVKSDEAYNFLCNWYLKIDISEDDVWLCLSPSDMSVPEFYSADILDRYCNEQVKELLKFDIIERVYVKDN